MIRVSRIGWQRDEPQANEALVDREWLLTNGLGGYASGTLAGVVRRRYHGLLVAALPNPFGRTMMFDHLVEHLRLPDGSIRRLSAEETDTGTILHGTEHLEEFRLELGLPIWTYRLENLVIEKRIVLAYLQNTVYLRYRLLEAPGTDREHPGLVMSLRPAMHFRPHDAPVSNPFDPYTLSLTGNRFEVSTGSMLPSLKIQVDGQSPTFEFFPERQEKVNYRWEADRGYEAHGTLWSPGQFKVNLTRESPVVLVASAETWETMGAIAPADAWRYENERRARLLHVAPGAAQDVTTAELVLAADQFLIAPAGRTEDAARARAQGEELRSVIAGYHWFTDWGRDTMISLEGLTLCTGRLQTAHFILHSFARYVRNGLIPNLFPEGSHEGLYHTADATLWFFHALDRYLAYTSDHETLRLLLPTLEQIIEAHVQGTHFGIGVDPADGLLREGKDGFALTWMDALCDGWVVTPRRGKAVEINALWFNALTLMGHWVQGERAPESAARYRQMAETAKASFNRLFWNESKNRLFDVIAGPDRPQDDSLRPNQIFAISLPHPVLDRARWGAVVDGVAEALLTPVGLRSLAPGEPDFKASYHGNLRTRDAAYHQGTVWSWLIGPFVDAWLKVHPDARASARKLLQGLQVHLSQACVGSVSEIFDAEAPFRPRGCIAQAWGVAELLRAWRLTAEPQQKGDPLSTASAFHLPDDPNPRFAVLPGSPFPLGATLRKGGVNFALFSEHGTRAFVCLYDPADPRRELARYELLERTAQVFHGLVPDVRVGALYGFRVDGPFVPSEGRRFNVNKLLINPYARALHGDIDFKGPIYGYPTGAPDANLAFSDQDDAAVVPKSVVLVDDFDWGEDRRPSVPWNDTIIYEAHVRGLTMRHPEVPEELRGTYAGIGHPAVIAHLQRLGITAIELLPVHAKLVDGYMVDKGLTNYWGYSTLAFFAPEQRYARASTPGAQVAEFKTMVKKLHAAGIEVILDVVYNHTGEGNQMGPTLSFWGLNNVGYYHHSPQDRRYNMEFTGCGNSLNLGAVYTMKLVLDSLRYWATEMHVDGFRFDLATTLGRMWPSFAFDKNAAFFQAVHQDPALSPLKMIAEPWDTGEGGQQLGNFPVLWSEWNGAYRDAVRRFWKGDESAAGELGYRLTGSADIFQAGGRRPHASINFITSHDGFTLHDLVSYDGKHNDANRDDNRDGTDDNHSWNHGAEGETDDQGVNELRDRTKRNLLGTLFLSRGVPMLTAGDEMGRTQGGNNNAYCQDNEISWVDWKLDDRRRALLDFTARLARLRRKEGVLREDHFFRGDRIWDSRLKDLAFFRPDGTEMPAEDWQAPFVRSMAYLLGGDTLVVPDKAGRRPMGNTLLVLLNAHHEDLTFSLPRVDWGHEWEVVVDTGVAVAPAATKLASEAKLPVRARSMLVLRRPPPGPEEI